MSRDPSRKNDRKLSDDDLFGDFKPMDEFIESESFDVTTNNKNPLGKFEITDSDKKKKPGHARPPKEDVSEIKEDELFGDFKPMEEFIESDSFDVTVGEGKKVSSNIGRQSKAVTNVDDDDLFGDFKPMDEFIESDSFEVTKSSNTGPQSSSPPQTTSMSPSTPGASAPMSASGPTPPTTSPISTPPSPTAGGPTPPAIEGPAVPPSLNTTANHIAAGPQANQMTAPQQAVIDPTKEKLAEIAKRRKKEKGQSKLKGDTDGLFDDLDPLELDDDL